MPAFLALDALTATLALSLPVGLRAQGFCHSMVFSEPARGRILEAFFRLRLPRHCRFPSAGGATVARGEEERRGSSAGELGGGAPLRHGRGSVALQFARKISRASRRGLNRLPMATPRESPSPTVPVIVLVIVMVMLSFRSLMAYDPEYWRIQMVEVETRYIVGAFLIPICLTLLVQAFGIPKVSSMDQPTRSGADAVSQDLISTMVLVGVLFSLFMLIPLRSFLLAA